MYSAKQLNVTQEQMNNYKAVRALNKAMMSPGQGGNNIAEYGGAQAVLPYQVMEDFYMINKRIRLLERQQQQRVELSDLTHDSLQMAANG